jgi:hypothetical protein
MPQTALSFANDIKPMLIAAGCACMLNPVDAAGLHPDKAFDVSNYQQVKDRALKILIEFVLAKMPPGAPFDYQRASKFAEWIDGGMLP